MAVQRRGPFGAEQVHSPSIDKQPGPSRHCLAGTRIGAADRGRRQPLKPRPGEQHHPGLDSCRVWAVARFVQTRDSRPRATTSHERRGVPASLLRFGIANGGATSGGCRSPSLRLWKRRQWVARDHRRGLGLDRVRGVSGLRWGRRVTDSAAVTGSASRNSALLRSAESRLVPAPATASRTVAERSRRSVSMGAKCVGMAAESTTSAGLTWSAARRMLAIGVSAPR
jgi:hypothetical protein